MTKPALAAVVALALSLPLANLSANAQGSSASVKAESKAQTQSTTNVQTTFSAPQQANRTRPATVGTAPSTWQTTTTSRGTTQTLVPAPPATPTLTTTTTTAATPAAPAVKTTDDSVIVTQSTPRVSSGTGTAPNWQKFYEYVKLKQGQDTIPLTLTVSNGNTNHPPFQNINMFLNGQKLASEKDFKGNTLSLKMDGTLTSGGNNQLLFQAYGPPTASLSWKLTTQRAVITAVTPDTAGPGDTIKISGRNFSNKVGVTQVWVGDKIAQLKSGNAKTLQAVVPDGVTGGESKVQVAVAGIAAKPFKITVKGNAPELSGTDLYGCPPGTEVTLSGKGFSAKADENVVTVGGVQAQVLSASATSIRFAMPELPNVWAAVPISVKTKNVASKNTVNVQPSNRLLPNSYQ